MLKAIAPYLKRAAVMPTPSRRGPPGSESFCNDLKSWAVFEPRHTKARTFALRPPIAVG